MNIKERKNDYLVYLLYLLGVIPQQVLKNYIVTQSISFCWYDSFFAFL